MSEKSLEKRVDKLEKLLKEAGVLKSGSGFDWDYYPGMYSPPAEHLFVDISAKHLRDVVFALANALGYDEKVVDFQPSRTTMVKKKRARKAK